MSTKTEDEKQALSAFSVCSFNYEQRIEWFVYGARDYVCPKCKQPPNQPCINMTVKGKIERGAQIPQTTTRWPHAERIDWALVVRGLRKRGYLK